MNANNGGSAFPNRVLRLAGDGQVMSDEWLSGMTLRDYFAAKAMQARLSQPHDPLPAPQWFGSEQYSVTDACSCYAVADAMLKAREVRS